jgi:hypothetical protein
MKVVHQRFRLKVSGDYERAAAWALFHGKVGYAVAALSGSKGKFNRSDKILHN